MILRTNLVRGIFIFHFLFIIHSLAISQEEPKVILPLDFENGKSYTLFIMDDDPDHINAWSIHAGIFGYRNRFDLFGLTYYNPQKSFFNLSVGLKGGIADANIFLFNWIKQSKFTKTIHEENINNGLFGKIGVGYYKARVPTPKRVSLGVHLGIAHTGPIILKNSNNRNVQIHETGLIVGISLLEAKYGDWKVKEIGLKRTFVYLSRINLDMVYYVQKNEEWYDWRQIDYPSQFATRIYYEAKRNLWRSLNGLVFNFRIGVEVKLGTGTFYTEPYIGGVGLTYDF